MKKVFCQVFKKQKKPAFMLTVAISKRNKLQNIIVLTPKDGHGCFFLSLGKRKVGKEISVFKNEKYGNEVFKCFDFRIEVVALLVFLFGVFIIYSGLR